MDLKANLAHMVEDEEDRIKAAKRLRIIGLRYPELLREVVGYLDADHMNEAMMQPTPAESATIPEDKP